MIRYYKIIVALCMVIAVGPSRSQAVATKLPAENTSFNDRWRNYIIALSDSLHHQQLGKFGQEAQSNPPIQNPLSRRQQNAASADSFQLVWAATFAPANAPSQDFATALVHDPHDGTNYVGGYTTLGNRTSILIVKLTAGGDSVWSMLIHGYVVSNDYLLSLSIDSSGNLFAFMQSDNTVGGHSSFIVKLSPAGHELWRTETNIPIVTVMAIDHNGDFVLVGGGQISKYSADGELLWGNSFDGTSLASLTIDSADNIYLGGARGSSYMFLAKYNALGNQIFLQNEQVGNMITSIAVTNDESIYLLAPNYGAGELLFTDPLGNIQWVVTFIPNASAFVAVGLADRCLLVGAGIGEYERTGTLLWNHPSTNVAFSGIAFDSLNNIYLSGAQSGSAVFVDDYFTEKYSSAGDSLSAFVYKRKSITANAPVFAFSDGGSYYVAGSDDFGAANDFLVMKVDANGEKAWQYVYNQGYASDVSASYTVSDKEGNVYLGGAIEDINGIDDFLLAKYDSNGRYLWASQYAAPNASVNAIGPMVVDDSGNVYVIGFSEAAVYETVTMKFQPNGVLAWKSIYIGPDSLGSLPVSIALDNNQQPLVLGRSGPGQEIDLTKYNSTDGHLEWGTVWSGPIDGPNDPVGVSVDHAGDIFLVANTLNYYDMGAVMQFATIKYNGVGQELWQRIYPAGVAVASYSLDADNNITIVGVTNPSGRVGWGTGIIAYSSEGDTLWDSNFGGQAYSPESGAQNPPAGSIADDSGNTIVAVTGDSLIIWKYAPNGHVLWTLRDSGDGISKMYRGSHGDFYYLLALGGQWNLEHYDFSGQKLGAGIQLPWTPTTISNSGDFIFGSTVVAQGNSVALAEYRRVPKAIEGVKLSQKAFSFKLMQNYPNPFNPTTRIEYSLVSASNVTITLYNILGQPVVTLVNAVQTAGNKTADWNAAAFASGVYFYKIEATPITRSDQNFVDVKKLVLIK